MASQQREVRKHVGLLIRLQHASVDVFADSFATNISAGGMFIRTKEPHPVATPVRFEVQIAGGLPVLRGTAQVRWTRLPDDPAGPSGMGLQFDALDAPSQALIQRMLAKKPASAPPPGSPPAKKSRVTPPVAPVAAPPKPAAPPPPPLEDEPLDFGDGPLAHPPTPEDHVEMDFESLPGAAPTSAPAPPPPPGGGFVEFDAPEDAGPSLELAFEPAARAAKAGPPPVSPAPKPLPPPAVTKAAAPPVRAVPLTSAGVSPLTPRTPLARLQLQSVPESRALRPGSAVPSSKAAPPTAPALPRAPPPPTLNVKSSGPGPETAGDPNRKTVFLPDPAPLSQEGPVIGIDLGTTNSCVAIFQGGRPTVLRSKDGYNTIPSILSLTPQGKLLLGHRAKDQLMLNPNDTIYGAKRLLGRPYESATVREVRERFHYAIVADASGKAAVRLGGKVVTLEEVQGLVLKECKEMAEQHLGRKVGRAVVTVPAYYAEQQREAVRRAGALAGIKVERILNEPTAAALAYGLNRQLSRKVMVYDLGGGTFDATVLRVQNNVFEVLATGGDTFLGGTDFDNAIVDLLIERFQLAENITFSGDNVALSRVHDAAERAKIALSERQTVDVNVPMVMMDERGKGRSLSVTLSRKDLDNACGHLVERTLDVVRDVLLDAKLKPSELDDVILVGGQSRMPLAREKLQHFLGKSPHASVNADEAVALGAALLAGTLDKVSSVVLIDVLPVTIGVGLPGGKFQGLLQRNTSLPAKATLALANTEANQRELEVFLFQGEDPHIAANEYLGTAKIIGLPPGKKGAVKVNLTLRLDPECQLSLHAKDESGKDLKTSLSMEYTAEQLQKRLNVSRESATKAEQARAEDLRSRGGKFWSFLKRSVGRA